MRKILLIGLIVVAAAVVVLFAREVRKADAPEQAAQEQGALMASPPAAAPQQSVDKYPVTARGLGIRGRKTDGQAWTHNNILQTRIPDAELTRDPSGLAGKIGIRVGPAAAPSLQGVAMDSTAVHEGRLFRIHVDNPGPGQGQLVVIGFYSELWMDDALNDQAYECKKCGNVTVCGVKPDCF